MCVCNSRGAGALSSITVLERVLRLLAWMHLDYVIKNMHTSSFQGAGALLVLSFWPSFIILLLWFPILLLRFPSLRAGSGWCHAGW